MSSTWRGARCLAILAACSGMACSEVALDLEGRPCKSGLCLSGYTCDPETYTCLPAELIDGHDECTGIAISSECYSHGTGVNDPTVGVGPCLLGMHTCNDYDNNGYTEYGPCVDEVVPAAMETCDNGVDDDCNGVVDDACDCDLGDEEPCYEGAALTEDVGICHGGTRCCDGGNWGACLGQQLPETELCNGLDDDCNADPDDSPEAATTQVCTMQGVCADGVAVCSGAGGWICEHADYEAVEVTCDGLDNDCDGEVDGEGTSDCAACCDGVDNDADWAIDYPDDPGCLAFTDDDEVSLPAGQACLTNGVGAIPTTGVLAGTTQGAGYNSANECDESGDGVADVYYILSLPAGAENVYVSTNDADTAFDSLIYLLSSCTDPDSALACGGELGFNPGASFQSGPLQEGTYYVVIDGQAPGEEGAYGGSIEIQVAEGWACDTSRGDWVCADGLTCESNPAGGQYCQP